MFNLPLALVAISIFYLTTGRKQLESAFYVHVSRSAPTISRNRRHEALGRIVALVVQLSVVFVLGAVGVDALREWWRLLDAEAQKTWWRRTVGYGLIMGFWCWRGGVLRTEWFRRWCVKGVEWLAGTTGDGKGKIESATINGEVGREEEQPLLEGKE